MSPPKRACTAGMWKTRRGDCGINFLLLVAETRGLDRIAVAHTANDQAETVLSHLLRGTGLTGLAGIYPVSGLIIRPLLELGREELRDFLSAQGNRGGRMPPIWILPACARGFATS